MKNIHGIEISGRQAGKKRPSSKAYIYEKNLYDDCITHYACPSCWFHCSEDFEVFSRHVIENHIDSVNNSSYNEEIIEEEQDDFDEDDGLEPIKRCQSNKVSTINGGNQLENKARQEELLGALDDLITSFKNLFNSGSKK
jgi:hypothetical protein